MSTNVHILLEDSNKRLVINGSFELFKVLTSILRDQDNAGKQSELVIIPPQGKEQPDDS
jgi:hypothetical protein